MLGCASERPDVTILMSEWPQMRLEHEVGELDWAKAVRPTN